MVNVGCIKTQTQNILFLQHVDFLFLSFEFLLKNMALFLKHVSFHGLYEDEKK